MKKKNIIFIVGLIIITLILIPIPIRLKDGGSIEYKAVLYSITKYHTLNPESSKGYDDGWKIKILGLTIHDEKNTYIKATNKDTEITWDEITIDGVNEELLFENIDIEVLNQIGTEFQSLVEEETEAEQENPEIVVTEGWGRVFKSERYKRVLDLGNIAMKPLYFILYKSSNAGAYEYLCARALYELSGFNFDWINSRDFFKKFNEQILNNK